MVTSEYAKTFFLGTQLMTPEKARAIWAIYVWCRRTDELVDGPNASRITPAVRASVRARGQRRSPLLRACRRRLTAGAPPSSPACSPLPLPVPQALDRWEERLEAIFEGRPYDSLDAALTDTISNFPVHIQPFRCARFPPPPALPACPRSSCSCPSALLPSPPAPPALHPSGT